MLVCYACTPDTLPTGEEPTAAVPGAGATTLNASLFADFAKDSLAAKPVTMATPTIYRDKLGVNFTWAADKLITGDPTFASTAFSHVRYFQMMEKDYNGGNPSNTVLKPCTNIANPWSCHQASMRQHLLRVVKLRSMFPNGYVWISPEVIAGKAWPCKGYTVAEMGPDPEEAGYQWARAALATYGPVGNVILQMSNEEWCQEAGRLAAYDQWRRGIIRAHQENPSCELALGASHVRSRTFNGQRVPDHVTDIAPDIWAYLNQVGGWADHHTYALDDSFHFFPYATAHTAPDVKDFFEWNRWVRTNYPNIRTAVGEIGYTTSPNDVVATPEQKIADWPTFCRLVTYVAREADIVFLYQIEDHAYPEGPFSGTGVFPALKSSIDKLSATALPKSPE